MRRTYVQLFFVALTARLSLAAVPLIVTGPGNIASCDGVTLSWSGGTSPYSVTIDDDSGDVFERVVSNTFQNEVLWTPDMGDPLNLLQVVVTDATGVRNGSDIFYFQTYCASSTSSSSPQSQTDTATPSPPQNPPSTTSTPSQSSPASPPSSPGTGGATANPPTTQNPVQTSPTASSTPVQAPPTASPPSTTGAGGTTPNSNTASSPFQASPPSSPPVTGTGSPTPAASAPASAESEQLSSRSSSPHPVATQSSGTAVPTGLSSPSPSSGATTGLSASNRSPAADPGMYAGIAIGGLAGLLLIVGAGFCWRRRRQRRIRELEELAAEPVSAQGRDEIVRNEKDATVSLAWTPDFPVRDFPSSNRAGTPLRPSKREMLQATDDLHAEASSSSSSTRPTGTGTSQEAPVALTPAPPPESSLDSSEMPNLDALPTNDLVRVLQARMQAEVAGARTEDLPAYVEEEPSR